MAQDRFLVGPYKTGWKTDVDPWLLPIDGYNDLRNAFIYEGRVHKRVGGKVLNSDATDPELNTRLRINLGNTDGAGNIAGTVPGVASGVVGQAFSIGSEVFTVNVLGAPAVMLTTGAATTHTYNTGTGAFVINGAAVTTALYFYQIHPTTLILVLEVNRVYRTSASTVNKKKENRIKKKSSKTYSLMYSRTT